MAFAVADCPQCQKRFRLRWQIGKKKLNHSQALRLRCPACRREFEIVAVKLVEFSAGKEHFPLACTVTDDCLVSAVTDQGLRHCK